MASACRVDKPKLPGYFSQFLSALLMVAPYAQHPVEINVTTGLNSKPYVDLTLAIMCDFGVEIERRGYESSLSSAMYLSKGIYPIESDASAASYFFAAPAICKGTVRVENITRRSKQGDIAFLDVLQKMGCTIMEGADYIKVTGPAELQGIHAICVIFRIPLKPWLRCPVCIDPHNHQRIKSARSKETDRVSATCSELARLGVQVEEHAMG